VLCTDLQTPGNRFQSGSTTQGWSSRRTALRTDNITRALIQPGPCRVMIGLTVKWRSRNMHGSKLGGIAFGYRVAKRG